MSNNEKDFEVCMNVENVHLPKSGFFGVSAATGGLAGLFYSSLVIRMINWRLMTYFLKSALVL